jgi:phosphatidylinositol alpha-1,6-mannosyltransferase
MKLLLISSEFPPGPGGIGHHAYSLCNALLRKGHDVMVMTVTDFATQEQITRFDAQQSFRVVRFPRIGWKTYINRVRMTHQVLSVNSFDYVLLTGKFSLWLGLYIKLMFRGTKTAAIVHGSEVNPSGKFVRMLTHYSLTKPDMIVPVSQFTKTLLPPVIQERMNIRIIPNGIDTGLLSTYTAEPRLELIGYPRLLTVGHVSPRKGQHRVIAALPVLRKFFPDLHYHIVGRPIDRDKLMGLATKLGVMDMVTFHGTAESHQSLASYYSGADVFMLLSENQPNGDVEGFGIVALEANYFGLPVVGAKYCGVEDAVDDGSSGVLVDGDDVNAIIEAVKTCVHEQARMRENAKEWALRHEWNEIVHQFLEVLK